MQAIIATTTQNAVEASATQNTLYNLIAALPCSPGLHQRLGHHNTAARLAHKVHRQHHLSLSRPVGAGWNESKDILFTLTASNPNHAQHYSTIISTQRCLMNLGFGNTNF
eukprot:4416966-Amphidinium_carterae.1